MQVVHELGHVLLAWASKGTVTKVALHPLIVSRTDLAENPHPLAVVWGGPLVGFVLPLVAFGAASICRVPSVYLFRFFAGFCLVANGVYIGTGWLIANGADPGVMIENGSPTWLLVVFGLLTFPAGLYLWHRQGHHFGLAEANGNVSIAAVAVSAALLIVLVAFELIRNQR
jgi:sterol desaturase/sphingolipid hydroxylase (fatty acid hydroxylase superfamily)